MSRKINQRKSKSQYSGTQTQHINIWAEEKIESAQITEDFKRKYLFGEWNMNLFAEEDLNKVEEMS